MLNIRPIKYDPEQSEFNIMILIYVLGTSRIRN